MAMSSGQADFCLLVLCYLVAHNGPKSSTFVLKTNHVSVHMHHPMALHLLPRVALAHWEHFCCAVQ